PARIRRIPAGETARPTLVEIRTCRPDLKTLAGRRGGIKPGDDFGFYRLCVASRRGRSRTSHLPASPVLGGNGQAITIDKTVSRIRARGQEPRGIEQALPSWILRILLGHVLREITFIAPEHFINAGLQQVDFAAHLLGFSRLESANVKV